MRATIQMTFCTEGCTLSLVGGDRKRLRRTGEMEDEEEETHCSNFEEWVVVLKSHSEV